MLEAWLKIPNLWRRIPGPETWHPKETAVGVYHIIDRIFKIYLSSLEFMSQCGS
jgi:hypothetical protein